MPISTKLSTSRTRSPSTVSSAPAPMNVKPDKPGSSTSSRYTTGPASVRSPSSTSSEPLDDDCQVTPGPTVVVSVPNVRTSPRLSTVPLPETSIGPDSVSNTSTPPLKKMVSSSKNSSVRIVPSSSTSPRIVTVTSLSMVTRDSRMTAMSALMAASVSKLEVPPMKRAKPSMSNGSPRNVTAATSSW